jgi:hypothetical protein
MEAKGDLRDAAAAAIEAMQRHVGRNPQDRGAALPETNQPVPCAHGFNYK